MAAGSVGVGTTPGAGAAAVGDGAETAGFGAFCRCHASQSMISEKLKTRSRINRRLSITVSAVFQFSKAGFSGYGIITARVPRMAGSDAAHGEPQALEEAMATQCLDGVVGTTGMKTAAIAQHGTDRQLVATYQPQQRLDGSPPTHLEFEIAGSLRRRLSISERQFLRCKASAARTWLIPRFNRKTRSRATRSFARSRKASRPCRFTALRNDALRASLFGTIHPSRATPPVASGPKCKSKHSPLTTRLASITAKNSPGRCKR